MKRKQFECLRCEWKWMGSKILGVYAVPKVCPSCKSPYWNKIKYLFKKSSKEYKNNR